MRLLVLLFVLLSIPATAQVLQLEQLNTRQITALDRNKTVVIIPGGILEEHGPYLPAYTDGYSDRYYADELARAIVARPGWTVLLYPQIPLGSQPANIIGGKAVFPGSYAVRTSTVRAVYMDLADDFGQQGFRWIFVLHNHLGPMNNLALDQAGDYFHDTYGGAMVHLLGLRPIADVIFEEQAKILTPEQLRENGLAVHADASEHSDVLFLHPEFVASDFRSAPTVAGETFPGLQKIAERADWPGYFGAPRFATAAQGARDHEVTLALLKQYALKIVDGFDYRSVPRHSDTSDLGVSAVPPNETAAEQRQQQWIAKHSGSAPPPPQK